MFDLIRAANTALDGGELRADNRDEIRSWFVEVDSRLGIVPQAGESQGVDEEIGSLIAQRNEARAARDFALADKVRQQLSDMNVIIEDTREGTRWRHK